MKARVCAVCVLLILLNVGIAFSQDDSHLKALVQLAPDYKDYQIQKSPLPVAMPSVSLRVITRVNRFARIFQGVVGAVPLENSEKQQAAATFEKTVKSAISANLTLKEDSPWRLVVVSGEGGGIMIGYGGIITAEVFLINTKGKTLVAYSKEPMGKGQDVNSALRDLASEVNKSVLKMARQAN